MGLTWMNNGFICKDLYAPFVLDKDSYTVNYPYYSNFKPPFPAARF